MITSKPSNWKEYLKSKNIITDSISGNPNIKLIDFLENPELYWNYFILSKNENIPVDYMISTFYQKDEHPKYPWSTFGIFSRIHFYDLNNLVSHNFNYGALSYNSNIPFSYVYKYKDKEWDWLSVIDYIITEYDYLHYHHE